MKMPRKVIIDTTNTCNSNCIMCMASKGSDEMPIEVFEGLAAELFPFAQEFHTSVNGEPFLTSYFERIPDILHNYSIRMSLTTNGTLLDRNKSRRVIQVLKDMKVSVDGARKSTFEKIRRGSDFRRVIRGIEDFVHERENSENYPTLTIQTALMQSNINEYLDIVHLAHELGADRLKAYFMVAVRGSMRSESLVYHIKEAQKILEEAAAKAKEYGIEVKFQKGRPIKKCHCLCEEGWIRVNGDVMSCCHFNAETMGNVYQSDFYRIWMNKKYEDMRTKQNSYKCCRSCSLRGDLSPNSLILGE